MGSNSRATHTANAAHLKFVMPLTSPFKQRAVNRHMPSPQFIAAVGASCVPTTLRSTLRAEQQVPLRLQGGGRIAVTLSSHHPASFGCTIPFCLQWDEAEGTQSKGKKRTSSPDVLFPLGEG